MIQLPPEEAQQLRDYFRDRRELGRFLTSQSNDGGLWEAATLYRTIPLPCERCGGDIKHNLPGTGFVDSKTGKAEDDPAVQRLCLELLGFGSLGPVGDMRCPDCDGHGRLLTRNGEALRVLELDVTIEDGSLNPPGITAQPTGSSLDPGSGGGEPQLDAIEAREVSDRLWRASEDDPGVGASLEAWYSDGGGELRALWHLTTAGRALIRRARFSALGNGEAAPAVGAARAGFWNRLLDAQAKHPDPAVAELLAAADKQAEKRLERATLRYLRAAPPPPSVRPSP